MNMNTYKVILVGDTSVGKTTLFNAFKLGKPDTNVILSTTSCGFFDKEVELPNNETVKLQIWDTAGQEQYQSITKSYYRDAKVIIICFDYERIQSVMQWVLSVREVNPNGHFIIVLTKKDMLSKDQFSEITNEINHLIETQIDNNEFIDNPKEKAKFIGTSGKENENVSELFQLAAGFYIIDHEQDIMHSNLADIKEKEPNDKRCC